MPRRLGIVAFVALLVPGLFFGRSSAHVFDAGTSIGARKVPSGTVERGDRVRIVGRLKSSQPACRQGKTVELKRRARTIRTDQTDAEGEFLFKIRARKTIRVFVRFLGTIESSYGHSHTCGGSRSQTIRIRVEPPTRPGDGDGNGGNGCHSSYPDFCIPPPPPDLDCDQVNGSNFTVIGSDPHGFDGDNDGEGCES